MACEHQDFSWTGAGEFTVQAAHEEARRILARLTAAQQQPTLVRDESRSLSAYPVEPEPVEDAARRAAREWTAFHGPNHQAWAISSVAEMAASGAAIASGYRTVAEVIEFVRAYIAEVDTMLTALADGGRDA